MTSKVNNNKLEYFVQPEGSLGLLALGAKGVIAWRKACLKHKSKEKNTTDNQQNN